MLMDKFKLNKEDSLLLVIDIQEKLSAVMEYKDEITRNVNILLRISDLMDIPVIITEQYPKGLGPTLNELVEGDTYTIIEKTRFSAYTDELKDSLKALKKKKIIVTGMETHVCVFQTVRDLLEAGYEVFLVGDGVTSRTKENYLNGINLITEMGAIIINTEAIAFELLKDAKVKEFKEISGLIK